MFVNGQPAENAMWSMSNVYTISSSAESNGILRIVWKSADNFNVNATKLCDKHTCEFCDMDIGEKKRAFFFCIP